MPDKILTELEVQTIGDVTISIDAKRCCTRTRAAALNCNVTAPSGSDGGQLITGVTRKVTYRLEGPTSITVRRGASYTGQFYGCTSMADSSWSAVTVAGYTGGISGASVTYQSGTSGRITFSFSRRTQGTITLRQTASGKTLVTTVNFA